MWELVGYILNIYPHAPKFLLIFFSSNPYAGSVVDDIVYILFEPHTKIYYYYHY